MKGLCFDIVKLGTVIGVFHQHGYGRPLVASNSRGETPSLPSGNVKDIANYRGDVIIERQKYFSIIYKDSDLTVQWLIKQMKQKKFYLSEENHSERLYL